VTGHRRDVPLVGLGVDWQWRRRYAGGLPGLCDRFRPRLSHISCVSLADRPAAAEFLRTCAGPLPTIHHLPGVAPAAPEGPNLDLLRRLETVSDTIGAAWICEDIGLWSIGPYPLPYFTPPLLEPDVARHVARGIRAMATVSRYPFLAEIPSCTFVAGRMDLGDFFRVLTEDAGCDLVLDVAHVYSYAVTTGRPAPQVLVSLPLERVVEIHVAGGHLDGRHPSRYIDSHSDPVDPAVLGLLALAVPDCPRLRAVTFEIGVGLSPDVIDRDLGRIETTIAPSGWVPSMERSRPRPIPGRSEHV